MNWAEWIAGESAIGQWKSAAEGLSALFRTSNRRVERPHAYAKKGAFWVEVRAPLDGVRLVAISMDRVGNTQGNITLRIWTPDHPAGAYLLFITGPRFTLQGRPWVRHLDLRPSGSWETQLRAGDETVRGLWYSGNLADFGSADNAEAVLRPVFRGFCEFVIEQFQREPPPQAVPTAGTPAAVPTALDEREISELVDGLVGLEDSERDAIVKARIGQSKFRDRLLARWGGACSVTALRSADVLIASHIVPWSRCASASERWDVNNGLMLTPGLDKAFELGYIGFRHEGREQGRIVISPEANFDIRRRLGFDDPQLRIRDWHQDLAPYLERHLARWHLPAG
jgi:hypothetical protein